MLSLRVKLLLFVTVLMLCFIAISGVILLMFNRVTNSTEALSHTDQALIHMLEARRREKDFFLHSDLKYVEQHQNEMDVLLHNIDEIYVHETNNEFVEKLGKIKQSALDYGTLFKTVKTLHEKRGLDEESGIRGQLRSAIKNVEAITTELGADKVTVSILMCRRHEKDYMLRGDKKYVTRLDDQVQILIGLIRELDFTGKNDLIRKVGIYKTGFHNLVDVDDEIAEETAKFRAKIHELEPVLNEYEEHVIETVKTSETTAQTVIVISVILLLISSLTIGLLLANNITKPLLKISEDLGHASIQMASASEELSSSAQVIASGATQQAASIEETSASMEELASIVAQNTNNSQEASSLSDKASSETEKGYDKMKEMLQSIEDINKNSTEINVIIKAIDEIAFQTNILALNAAVEAARAGDAGMGFAVVADEVKNLADRSAEAAKETTDMLSESVSKTNSGLEMAHTLSDLFKSILGMNQKVSHMSKEVESASVQQKNGLDQVNQAIITLDRVIQTNASSAEEFSGSAEQVAKQASLLNESVNTLVVIVKGKAAVHKETKQMSPKRLERG